MLVNYWITLSILQLLLPAWCQNFYDTDPNILELTPKTFDKVIHRTNYTSVVEFYAPWCGYCQQLKGTMQKVAKSLEGIVQVASVNCDLAKNKQLCAQQKIEGFPTIMVFRPPKFDTSKSEPQHTAARAHASEVFMGKRKLTAIVDFALSRMKSYVKRLAGITKLETVLQESPRKKLFLFSHKDDVSPTFKSIALDWLNEFDCFTIPNKKLSPLPEASGLQVSHPQIHESLQSLIAAQKSSKKSIVAAIDPTVDEIYIYEGKALTKEHVSKFLLETFEIHPREGPFSSRAGFLDHLRKGEKKSSGSKDKKKHAKKANHDEL